MDLCSLNVPLTHGLNNNRSNLTIMSTNAENSGMADVRPLLEALESYNGSPTSRLTLLQHTRRLQAALEEPHEKMTNFIEGASALTALSILIRVNALENLPESGSITVADLARTCGVPVTILTRAFRVLTANGISKETEPHTYVHNEASRFFLPALLGGFTSSMSDCIRAVGALPDYVKSHSEDDLSYPTKSPYSFMAGYEGKTFYEILEMDPQQRRLADLGMKNSDRGFPVLGLFPFEILEGKVRKEPERPFVVDIAGGRGQALLQIQKRCPFGGKFILQDLAVVIESLGPGDVPGIETMVYDMLMPQPVESGLILRFLASSPCLTLRL